VCIAAWVLHASMSTEASLQLCLLTNACPAVMPPWQISGHLNHVNGLNSLLAAAFMPLSSEDSSPCSAASSAAICCSTCSTTSRRAPQRPSFHMQDNQTHSNLNSSLTPLATPHPRPCCCCGTGSAVPIAADVTGHCHWRQKHHTS